MRRLAAISLVLCFLALGSGVAAFLHNLNHARQDAVAASAATAAGQPVQHRNHDDSNCDTHLQLHMPLLSAAWVPLLICLGLFVAFLTLLPAPLISRRAPTHFDSRGPPTWC